MNQFLYTVYGLTIALPIELPGLASGAGETDVRVSFGVTPETLQDSPDSSKLFQVASNKMLLRVLEVARFLIVDGREIVIEKEKEADDDDVRLFLLGSVLGAVLHCRGVTPLHGNGFVHEGEAVLVLGNTGVGKSTLAAALAKKGYTLLADDVCAVDTDSDGRSIVFPGVPHVKLWKDAASKIGLSTGGLTKVTGRMDKFVTPLHGTFCKRAVPLKKIFILTKGDVPSITIERLSNIKSMFQVKRHTYRKHIIKPLGREPEHFKKCGEIVNNARVKKITRPLHGFFLDELVESVENDLGLPVIY